MKIKYTVKGLICFLCLATSVHAQKREVGFCGSRENDLYLLLQKENFGVKRYKTPAAAVMEAPEGTGVFIVADGYPAVKNVIPPSVFGTARKRGLRLYIEYPASLPDLQIPDTIIKTRLERGVVTSALFGDRLKPMSLLGINDCHVLPVKVKAPLIVLAKVAGFDKAVYGLADVKSYPLLFRKGNRMVATTRLSSFATGRYGPRDSWQQVWGYIISWVTGTPGLHLDHWISYVSPTYGKQVPLPANARRNAIDRGVRWFYNGHFFVDPSWKARWLKYQGDGTLPVGPPVGADLPNGDGSLGILEGHASNIYYDGREQYRYWMRADVQGEVSYALAAAGNFLHKDAYYKVASNLADFIFYGSNLRGGLKRDPHSPVFGLLGWSVTHPGVFYGDDNARCILGLIGASAYMGTDRWDKEILENIIANFRTTGKEGFRDGRLEEPDILEKGWKYYQDRDIVNPHPHFESWLWACYLWLYDKTGYTPLLTKTKEAIRLTMEAYPGKWLWTNGIQQERARMILPLAWLVRIEDTPEHRRWLDEVVSDLLVNQMPCGAIREELGGAGKGMFGPVKSNAAYGTGEAPLIFKNGDPVADMLYTSNFAFFSLNEAAHATGNKRYAEAVRRLSDFLVRIQVKSDRYKDVDGAWFRAFDYHRWDYWASNADAGWGAWSTLTGWIQSWIVTTQVLVARNGSYWQLTHDSAINKYMQHTVRLMLDKEYKKAQ